ncbi:MAG: DNA-methyltransferase [Phycisphaerales bacterium]
MGTERERKSPPSNDGHDGARRGGTLETGDNLPFMRSLADASIDFVYIDPPFNTGGRRRDASGEYPDSWLTVDDYLEFMRPRLREMRRLLRPTGSLMLHCDWRSSHHLRLLLDDLFGADAFINHLIWSYGLGGSSPRRFARKHDDILFYGRSTAYFFDAPRVPATSARMRGQLKKATDVIDIPTLNNMARERTGYPTQKPLKLLDLLIRAACPAGGVVADFFCGSGTTLVAAQRLDRGWIGCDISSDAIRITRERLDHDAGAV